MKPWRAHAGSQHTREGSQFALIRQIKRMSTDERPLKDWVVDGSDSSTLIRCQRHHSSPPGPEPAHSQHHRSPSAAILSPNAEFASSGGRIRHGAHEGKGVTLQGCHESLGEEVDQYAPPTKALVNCRFHSNVRWRAVCCVCDAVSVTTAYIEPALLSDTCERC